MLLLEYLSLRKSKKLNTYWTSIELCMLNLFFYTLCFMVVVYQRRIALHLIRKYRMSQFLPSLLNPLVYIPHILDLLIFIFVLQELHLESFIDSSLESMPVPVDGDCRCSYEFSCFTHALESMLLSIWTGNYYAGSHNLLVNY